MRRDFRHNRELADRKRPCHPERGRVFSIYMVGTFLALALGQLLIARVDIKSGASFNAIVALFAVALIMVTTASG